jgi:transposase-like protein
MAHYPPERREAVVRRMLTEGLSMAELARDSGISEGTLYRWREAAQTSGEDVSKTRKPQKRSARAKLAAVAETAALNEAELAEYCRRQGLYPEDVKAWRAQAESALAGGVVPASELRAVKAAEKKRLRALERELHRKDKALAETAALLTLRKKAAAIWGEAEDA